MIHMNSLEFLWNPSAFIHSLEPFGGNEEPAAPKSIFPLAVRD